MTVIWKYTIPVDDQEHEIAVPEHSHVLHVESQTLDTVSVWVWVSNRSYTSVDELQRRTFKVVGTGHEFNGEEWGYLGTTFAYRARSLVWHLLERIND